jgi:transcriptional regulator with XRE-family HTH domain
MINYWIRNFIDVADTLRRLRHQRDLTQAKAALRAGFLGGQLSAWENARQMPDVDTILRMINAYGYAMVLVPIDEARAREERAAVALAAKRWHAGTIDAAALEDAIRALLEAEAKR